MQDLVAQVDNIPVADDGQAHHVENDQFPGRELEPHRVGRQEADAHMAITACLMVSLLLTSIATRKRTPGSPKTRSIEARVPEPSSRMMKYSVSSWLSGCGASWRAGESARR